MGIADDDGWINSEDYDGDIPFLSDEENEENARKRAEKAKAAAYNDELPFPCDFENDGEPIEVPKTADVIGDCPVCGSHIVDREKAYSCSNYDCRFALWKDNKFFQAIGKEMTKDIAEELLTCGTVKLDHCKSRKTGNSFNCYVDITADEEGRAQYVIRFPERKRGGE